MKHISTFFNGGSIIQWDIVQRGVYPIEQCAPALKFYPKRSDGEKLRWSGAKRNAKGADGARKTTDAITGPRRRFEGIGWGYPSLDHEKRLLGGSRAIQTEI